MGLFDDTRLVDPKGYLTDLLGDEAARWIGTGTAPFFLSLHFNAPHSPWEVRDDDPSTKPPRTRGSPPLGSLETFGRMVTAMDDNIGKVLAALARHDMDRDTIVVLTSDNGGKRYSDVWPFTGLKGRLLEGGLLAPLIVRWPGRISAGATSQQVMTSMDFLPTLLAAAGHSGDPSATSDGLNLMTVLTGAAAVIPRKLFWRYKNYDQRAVRDGDWKYLRINGNKFLFNVAQDPRERADRKRSHPEVFARLKADFDAWNATMLPYPVNSFSYIPKAADRYWAKP